MQSVTIKFQENWKWSPELLFQYKHNYYHIYLFIPDFQTLHFVVYGGMEKPWAHPDQARYIYIYIYSSDPAMVLCLT